MVSVEARLEAEAFQAISNSGAKGTPAKLPYCRQYIRFAVNNCIGLFSNSSDSTRLDCWIRADISVPVWVDERIGDLASAESTMDHRTTAGFSTSSGIWLWLLFNNEEVTDGLPVMCP